MPANGGASTSFSLSLQFRNGSDGDPIAFKVDGERFEQNTRSLKFGVDSRYRITVETKPPVEFHHMHIGGSDLAFLSDDPKTGTYVADWNTTGILPSKRGARENIGLNLQGPGGLLRTKLQCKFYKKDDSHATWGHKMLALEWTCSVDTSGNIAITDEKVK